MLRSMYSGITGLRNFQTKLDVIGNNIANVNTYGFKKGRTVFKDLVSQTTAGASAPGANRGGVNPQQVGLGSQIAAIDTLHGQGSSQFTGNTLDLSITGDGFFQVMEGNEVMYTRAGNFYMDQNGDLVDGDGRYVVGADGVINIPPSASSMSVGQDGTVFYVDLPDGAEAAIAAAEVVFRPIEKRFKDAEKVLNDAKDVAKAAEKDFKAADKAADKADATATRTAATAKAAADAVIAAGTAKIAAADAVTATGIAKGTAQGIFDGLNTTPPPADLTALEAAKVVLDAATAAEKAAIEDKAAADTAEGNAVTNAANATTAAKAAADAKVTADEAKAIAVTAKGTADTAVTTATGPYNTAKIPYDTAKVTFDKVLSDNKATLQEAGQIEMATFSNPGGLEKTGGNLFRASANSGDVNIGSAMDQGFGTVGSGFLEMSNVDLAEEFTEMIVAQRGFQANTRIITTSDEILQELVNLKR